MLASLSKAEGCRLWASQQEGRPIWFAILQLLCQSGRHMPPNTSRYNGAIFMADFRLAPHVGVSPVCEDVETALRPCVI
jgi:hypothetical protein